MPTSTRDRGQAAVLVLILATVLFVALSSALVTVGGRMIDRTRAQTAADAAALAALVGGPEAARTLAQRHGASLLSLTFGPASGQVDVEVRLGTATARAAASDAP
ncbi:MAG TPA: pilus assembly protein TadG-related protein [Ilumatobacteraceae bacterium]|nr:pilus assembly protein TadG-related protein [Ilumatobacteraceae bacterium]